MNKDFSKTRRGRTVHRMTLLMDELSIMAAFATAFIIRYQAIVNYVNWFEYSYGIYVSMIITALLFQFIVFFLYDYRGPNVVEMDPVDNLVRIVKSRAFLIILFILYLFTTQKSVLASRIVVGLFLLLSVILGYIFRMVYRHFFINRYGVMASMKSYHVTFPIGDIDAIAKEISDGGYDCALLIKGSTPFDETRIATRELEKRGIRTFTTLYSLGYEVRSGIVTDVDSFAAIPAYVRAERFEIFGLRYCIARVEEAVLHVMDHIEDLRGKYVCFSNVHTTVMAREDESYREILNGAALLFPDGTPIARLEGMKGNPAAERVAGPDFMHNMFRDTMDGKISHYFYGSSEKTLKNLEKNLRARYPGINIKGMYSPPFRELTKEEDEADIKRINDSGADIVWIGLGAPKQEKWMNAHQDRINAVMMGVGAGFDFHAGTIQRAPIWLQKIGLEWLYRLFKDPVRLYKRYIVTNVKFVWYLIRG